MAKCSSAIHRDRMSDAARRAGTRFQKIATNVVAAGDDQ